MTTLIQPSTLSGSIRIPQSKSLLHRGLFCAALAGDLSLCELPTGADLSDDIRITHDCMKKLLAGESEFFCGESGTTLRLLIPVVAAKLCHARFTGAGRLPQRPLAEYRDAFAPRGVTFDFPANDFLPLEINGRLRPGVFNLPGNVSSQYISGVLLALPLLGGDSEIVLTSPLESAPYVEMTRDVMLRFGVRVEGERSHGRYCLIVRHQSRWSRQGSPYKIAKPYVAEPDFSQAAFWQLAQFLGHGVMIENLPEKTSQGDAFYSSLLDVLAPAARGDDSPGNRGPLYGTWRANVRASRNADGCEIDVSQIPDLFPALAAAASFADGKTRLYNAARLRLKESDRIASTCKMLRAFGVEASGDKASLTVHGRAGRVYNACTVDSQRDHRIVMAATMLATRANGPVTILGSDAVAKSYPTFFDHFKHAGGICS